MKVIIDTNIILDVLSRREPHFETSAAILKFCGAQIIGFITASQTTDIFYLLRRDGKGSTESKKIIQKLTDNIKIADVTTADVKNALNSDMADYEDALLAFAGKRQKAKHIVTRNKKDYEKSPIPAISPQMLIKQFFEG